MTGFQTATSARAVRQFIVMVLFCESRSPSRRKPLLLYSKAELPRLFTAAGTTEVENAAMRCWNLGLTLAAGALAAAPLAAHDFWLQPLRFWAAPGAAVPMTFLVGHGAARQRSSIATDRFNVFRAIGPQGVVDHKSELTLGQAADVAPGFQQPGTYVVAFSTSNVASDLPALRFNDYAAAEGLTLVLQQRAANNASTNSGRELYSRRGKALIQVGLPGRQPQPHVTAAIGLGLEIVPLLNPYALGNSRTLPVRVLYQGRPLVGALVKLNDLAADAEPVEKHLTDSNGLATFAARRSGDWQLNVVWSQPMPRNPQAEFLTTFSSLSFGFSGRPAGR